MIAHLQYINSNTIHMCPVMLSNYIYYSDLCMTIPVVVSLYVRHVPVHLIRYFIRDLGNGFAQTPRETPAQRTQRGLELGSKGV